VSHRLLAVLLTSLELACQAPSRAGKDAAPGGPPAACTQLGAPCTVSPGKLGTCVEVERPSGPSAFVCQSQH
jgi:hypothetical protein